MLISKHNRVKLKLNAFVMIMLFYCLLSGNRYAYCGECLSSDEDMYSYVLEFYKNAIIGEASIRYEGIELHCWRGNDDLNKKLKATFEEMISDTRLHPVYIKEVVDSYIKMFGPTEFILNYFKRSQGIVSRAIIENLMYQNDTLTFNVISFIKKQIQIVTDIELRRQLVEILANKKSIKYQEFIQFCQDNKILPEDKVIFSFRDMEALEYIYNVRKLEDEPIDYSDKEQMKHYHRYSKFIHNILAYNLDKGFQKKYLDRMTLEDLRYLRNGILASYGKIFRSKLLQYYYYGEYPYVNQYCRNGQCGLGTRKKGGYKDSDLTEIDKANIEKITKIEEHYKSIGYSEPGLFIENYDIQAFLKNHSKRLTFSSSNMVSLKQIKLDWENKKIWAWDKNGISGWSLESEKRSHFIKNGKGPISFSPKNKLLSLQKNNRLVLKNIDSNKIVYQQDLKKYTERGLNERYSLFSKDEKYFIFSTYGDDYDRYAGTITFSILQINTMKKNEIKIPHEYRFCYVDMSSFLSPVPFIITEDNKYIIALVLKDKNTYFAIIPLNSEESIRFINSGLPSCVLSMAVDHKNENIYLSLYYNQNTLLKYTITKILDKDYSIIDPDLIIDCEDTALGYLTLNQYGKNLVFRGDGHNLAWINLEELKQLNVQQYNERPLKTPKQVFEKHKITLQQRIFKEIPVHTFDISEKDKLIAAGNEKGFVVIEHFPNPEDTITKSTQFEKPKPTIDITNTISARNVIISSKATIYEKGYFDKIDFIDESADIYDKPMGKRFEKIFDNTKVDILQKKGDWVEIKCANIQGWVSKGDLLGENVNKLKEVGYSTLSKAAFMGRLETVIFLLKKGADVNLFDHFGRNSLHWAIKGGFLQVNIDQIEILKHLINAKGIDINKVDKDSVSPLLLAVMSQNLEIVKLLSNQNNIDINKANAKGETPIICAVKYRNNEIVRHLLAMPNLDINSVDQDHQSPIFYAVMSGNIEITKLLLARNAQVDIVNNNEETLLHAAFKCYPYSPLSLELITLLLSLKDIDINRFNSNNQTPLLLAIESRNIDIVKILLSTDGIDVNANSYQDGNIYLRRIVPSLDQDYYRKLAKLFLSHENIDINMPDKYGRTLLFCDWYYFQSEEALEIIKLMLTKNPDINIIDKDGNTPLYYNVNHKKLQIVRLLLNVKGININMPNRKESSTPLEIAKFRKYTEIIQLLIEAGAKE